MIEIDKIKEEYQSILNKLNTPEFLSDYKIFQETSKRKDFLEKILAKISRIEKMKKEMAENKKIISEAEDEGLKSLAEEEIEKLKTEIKKIEKELEEEKEEKEEIDNIIVEIRAGVGGEEAALFVKDLFEMYSKYGQKNNCKINVWESSFTDINGLKEIIFEMRGKQIFEKMKYEGGVHRVQRIPSTEKNGRIHTSTVSVAILPVPKATETKLDPRDIKIDIHHSSGHGGQYVNKRLTAVRIFHIPTGIMVDCQTERSLEQNKERALKMLSAKIYEKKLEAKEKEISDARKKQIGWAKRCEKIRTYNFPQDRITDHRINKSWHNIEKIMNGEMEPIIETFKKIE